MLAEYLKAVWITWKSHVREALFFVGLLVALGMLTKPRAWAYGVLFSVVALLAPYWAYKRLSQERDSLNADCAKKDSDIHALRDEREDLRARVKELEFRPPTSTSADVVRVKRSFKTLLAQAKQDCGKKHRAPGDALPWIEKLRTACSGLAEHRRIQFGEQLDFREQSTSKAGIGMVHIIDSLDHTMRPWIDELAEEDVLLPTDETGPSDEERLEAAKAVLREGSADMFDKVVRPDCTYETAKRYTDWAYRLLVAIFGADTVHARTHLIYDYSPEDHAMRKNPMAACERLAKALGDYPNYIRLPTGKPGDPSHLLSENFTPKPGMTWKDY